MANVCKRNPLAAILKRGLVVLPVALSLVACNESTFKSKPAKQLPPPSSHPAQTTGSDDSIQRDSESLLPRSDPIPSNPEVVKPDEPTPVEPKKTACTPGQIVTEECPIANGLGTKKLTCNASGTGFDENTCAVQSCLDSFQEKNGECFQGCVPLISETRECPYLNGKGKQTRTCSADGIFGPFSEKCQFVSCDSGFKKIDGSCIRCDSQAESYCRIVFNANVNVTQRATLDGQKGRLEIRLNLLNLLAGESLVSVTWGPSPQVPGVRLLTTRIASPQHFSVLEFDWAVGGLSECLPAKSDHGARSKVTYIARVQGRDGVYDTPLGAEFLYCKDGQVNYVGFSSD